ncbi:ecotin family protein [Prevotella sp. OH937_COT-195]|uniref:ecotin family protein n=1 Tax=Prevotella sp. OH937_COT-195 TaxID=2491051 RepID=UPI000F6556DB|nr:ecotin family protein [Prevotella sp. OH937_COT-195]RRD02732.1 ecotin [Prevotella sp. OH937_COT-195]
MRINKFILTACLIAGFIKAHAQYSQEVERVNDEIDLKVFPLPDKSQNMVVFHLPDSCSYDTTDSKNLRVELIVGKTMLVDCNKHVLMGTIEEKILNGYGYPYYTFTTNGEIWSTQMLCAEGSMHEEFVRCESLTIDYNRKLPFIVYMPLGYELKYRIWTAGETTDIPRQ